MDLLLIVVEQEAPAAVRALKGKADDDINDSQCKDYRYQVDTVDRNTEHKRDSKAKQDEATCDAEHNGCMA